jgi:hypothetical protein
VLVPHRANKEPFLNVAPRLDAVSRPLPAIKSALEASSSRLANNADSMLHVSKPLSFVPENNGNNRIGNIRLKRNFFLFLFFTHIRT